ncbi:MAG: hypothetical protein N2C14_28230 [Planctomycetales bacterium]
MDNTPSDPPAVRLRFRKWHALAVLLVVALVFHQPLLRGTGGLLTRDDAGETGEFIVLASGNIQDLRRYDMAAELIASGEATKVLLIPGLPTRIQELGIAPTSEQLSRDELARRDVSPDVVWVYQQDPDRPRTDPQLLGDWLDEHPLARVTVLCDRFESGSFGWRCRSVTSPDAASRIQVRSLTGVAVDETNWWKSRGGWKLFGQSWFRWFHSYWFGERPRRRADWDPDEYVKGLK